MRAFMPLHEHIKSGNKTGLDIILHVILKRICPYMAMASFCL